MKRITSLILVLVMCLSLASCGTAGSRSQTASDPSESHNVPDAPSSEQMPSAEPSAAPPVSASSAPSAQATIVPTDAPPPPSAAQSGHNDAYFDGALFVGDSIMEGIRQYVAQHRQTDATLGSAQFLTTTMGISLADLVGDRQAGIYYSYKGEEKSIEQIVAEVNPSRIFLLLGLNDLTVENPVVDDVIGRYSRLIDNLHAVTSNAEIVVMLNPPKVVSAWLPSYTANRNFGNQLIDEFVSALTKMCDDRAIPYVDAHTALSDDNGALPDEFCRDGYIHLNNSGAAVVVDALYEFAKGRT